MVHVSYGDSLLLTGNKLLPATDIIYCMQSNGKRLHAQASQAREEGKLDESLRIVDDALLAYDEENDNAGFAEGLGCKSITLRLLGEQRESKRLLHLANHIMLASVEIVKESQQPEALAIPFFELGKTYEYLHHYKDAVNAFTEAVKTFETHPPQSHNRSSVLADMRVHLAVAQYMAGNQAALDRAEKALYDLETTEEDAFNKDVWVSGGYMHLAEALRTDNPEKANEYVQKAKAIIDANPQLVIRKQQWEKLIKGF